MIIDIKLKPLHLALIQGLLNWDYRAPNGWKTMRQILSNAPNWKSQIENFPKYINYLTRTRMVKERIFEYNDTKGRPRKRKEWRLKQNTKAFLLIKNSFEIYQTSEYMKRTVTNNYKPEPNKYGHPFLSDYYELLKNKFDIEKILKEEVDKIYKDEIKGLEFYKASINHSLANLKELKESEVKSKK